MADNAPAFIRPDLTMNDYIHRNTSSDFRYCFTCKSCATECPVNIFTGRLNPARLVRLASFGLKDTLIRLSDIWYCLGCGKCSNICPMNVRPHILISNMCNEAISNHLFSLEIKKYIFELFLQFQRVRLQLVHMYINGEDIDHRLLEDWDSLANLPMDNVGEDSTLILGNLQRRSSLGNYKGIPTEIRACLTCRECSNACPICLESKVFDPLYLFRAIALGLKDVAVSMPSLWLCIECETCSNSCSQGVKGHLVMKQLKRMAIESGILDEGFLSRWNNSQRILFNTLLNKVDLILEKFSL